MDSIIIHNKGGTITMGIREDGTAYYIDEEGHQKTVNDFAIKALEISGQEETNAKDSNNN